MRLYHFTDAAAVPLIQAQGIQPSHIEIPHVGQSSQKVVSLTGNPDPSSLLYASLWDGSELTGPALAGYRLAVPDGPVPLGRNTISYRIDLDIPDDDVKLYAMLFPDIKALGFVSQHHIDEFVGIGGGVPDEWRIYLGVVPTSCITAVHQTGA